MNALSSHAEDYLRLRRALGFKLERAGQLLPQLVAYLEAGGAGTVTADLAIAWARLPDATPNHRAQRLAIARGFARYLQAIDPAAEVPPPGVFPARRHRPSPYLFSHRDICRILQAARILRPPLRAPAPPAPSSAPNMSLCTRCVTQRPCVSCWPATTSPSSRCGWDTSRSPRRTSTCTPT